MSVSPTANGVSPGGVRTTVAPEAATVVPIRMCNGPYSAGTVRRVTSGCNLGIVCSTTRTFNMRIGNRNVLGTNSVDALDFRTAGMCGAVRNNTVVVRSRGAGGHVSCLGGFNFTKRARIINPNVGDGVSRVHDTCNLLGLGRISTTVRTHRRMTVGCHRTLHGMRNVAFFSSVPNIHRGCDCFPVFVSTRGCNVAHSRLCVGVGSRGILKHHCFCPLVDRFSACHNLRDTSPTGLPGTRGVTSDMVYLPVRRTLDRRSVREALSYVLEWLGAVARGGVLVLNKTGRRLGFMRTTGRLNLCAVIASCLGSSPYGGIYSRTLVCGVASVSGVMGCYRRGRISNIMTNFLSPYRVPCTRVYRELGLPYAKAPRRFFAFAGGVTFGRLYEGGKIGIVLSCAIGSISGSVIRCPIFMGPISDHNSENRAIYCSGRRVPRTVGFTGDRSSGKSVLVRECVNSYSRIRVAYFLVGNRIFLREAISDGENDRSLGLRGIIGYSVSPSGCASVCLDGARTHIYSVVGSLNVRGNPVFVRKFCGSKRFCFFSPKLEFPNMRFREICGAI